MKTSITFEEALAKASKRLQEKMLYSVNLLKKAEKLAHAYGGGIILLLVEERTLKPCIT